MINERARRTREINTANGWNPVTKKDWEEDENRIPAILALIHSEINEAHEQYIADNIDELATEFADVEIRVLDCCGGLVSDFEACVMFAWDMGTLVPEDTNLAFMVAHQLVTRALEHYRDNEPGLFLGELAKLYVFNRCFAIHTFQLDMEAAVESKLEKNRQRSYRHGGKRV